MAAYTALLSLTHTINDINNHPCPPISLHQQHLHSLTEILTFLQDFLERYSSEDDNDLESRITDAARAAEHVIENHIVHQTEAGSTSHDGKNISSVGLYEDLQRAIQDLNLIKKDVMVASQVMNMRSAQHDHLHKHSSARTGSTWQSSSTMVDFDDPLVIEVLDKLVGEHSSLQIIPIVGMGGIGKTTFARTIYSNPVIVQHFDILAWITISQVCSRIEILSQVLHQIFKMSKYELKKMGEDKMGEMLHKHLWGRRYMIVMDDIWSLEQWDEVKSYFPDRNNGSRIMTTTRQSHLAVDLSGSHYFRMEFLDDDKSWDLLREVLLGKETNCPVELDIGKEIARKCRGLPLSIVVMGGILKKSKMTQEYWLYALRNLNPLINLEGDEYCLQILHTSYRELPLYLKPCFRYMGVFQEGKAIRVSDLIRMWVAEGILKPIDHEKSLEEAAEVYLQELIDRNLIMVDKIGWNGRVKTCRVHDILRDLCLREGEKQRFNCQEVKQSIHMTKQYICINKDSQVYRPRILKALMFAHSSPSIVDVPESICRDLWRVRYLTDGGFLELNYAEAIIQQIHSRYLSLICSSYESMTFALCSYLWNLQTFTITAQCFAQQPKRAPFDIWKMPLLRHAKLGGWLKLSDVPHTRTFVLEHLHTLKGVVNFKCDEETVERIPNVRKLELKYAAVEYDVLPGQINLLHLNNLHKLESLAVAVLSGSVVNITFPHCLRKLTLFGTELDSEELTTKISSLPLLHYLKIGYGSFRGCRWTADGRRFCSLKFLHVERWHDLKHWTADAGSYPCLEHLVLDGLEELEEIPCSIGDMPTLQSIRLERCAESAADSAQRIKQEQLDFGNEDLQVVITDTLKPGESLRLIRPLYKKPWRCVCM